MQAVSGPGWQAAVESSVPGSTDQACEDAAALFEVEVPALLAWGFEEDAARGLTPPVLFGIGSESGELFEGPRRLFMSAVGQAEDVVLPGLDHLLQMRDSGLVARPIAEFLTRHPL